MQPDNRNYVHNEQCYKLACISVALAIILSGCNCSTGQENRCFYEHCPPNANPNACLEGDQHDLDCCAAAGSASCVTGYSIRGPSDHRCHFVGAVTTCCIADDENGDGVRDWKEPSPRWWFVIFGGILGFCFCFACCAGCASHEPLKQFNDRGVALRKMWMSVALVCFVCTLSFYVVMSPNSNSEKERSMLTLFGTIGDGVGCAVGFIVCCIILQPRLKAKLRNERRATSLPTMTPGGVAHWPAHNPEVNRPLQAQQSGMVVGTVVTSQPVPNNTSIPIVATAIPTNMVSSARPSLNEMVDVFKRELGLKSTGSIPDVVAESCGTLAIKTEGLSLIQQAEKCWDTLMGTSGTQMIAPSLDTPASSAVVVGRPVQDQFQPQVQTSSATSQSASVQGEVATDFAIEENPVMEETAWRGDNVVVEDSMETKPKEDAVPEDSSEKERETIAVKEDSTETEPEDDAVPEDSEPKTTAVKEDSTETEPKENAMPETSTEIEPRSTVK